MKKALIITGGYINFNKINISTDYFDLIIAADSGYVSAAKLKIEPHIIVGDFDSAALPDQDAEIITFPCEKDDTDTMLACKIAIEKGANDLTIIGGTGGRADHFLSNVFSLERFKDIGVNAVLFDGENKIAVLENESMIINNHGGYFSIFALGDCTVTANGCKYPLQNHLLTRENPSFAVSNEVIEDYATITVKGKAVLCECQK